MTDELRHKVRSIHPEPILQIRNINIRKLVYVTLANSWLLNGDTWNADIKESIRLAIQYEHERASTVQGVEVDYLYIDRDVKEITALLEKYRDVINAHLETISPSSFSDCVLLDVSSTASIYSVSRQEVELLESKDPKVEVVAKKFHTPREEYDRYKSSSQFGSLREGNSKPYRKY